MPLYKTITVNKETSVAIWKVEATEAPLWKGVKLIDHCQKRFNVMNSVIHRQPFLTI